MPHIMNEALQALSILTSIINSMIPNCIQYAFVPSVTLLCIYQTYSNIMSDLPQRLPLFWTASL